MGNQAPDKRQQFPLAALGQPERRNELGWGDVVARRTFRHVIMNGLDPQGAFDEAEGGALGEASAHFSMSSV